MTEKGRICSTCCKVNRSKLYKLKEYDTDHISYSDKLKYCVKADLVLDEDMGICWLCVKHLRISYKFRQTVLTSQENLQNADSTSNRVKQESLDSKPFSCTKQESDSDADSFLERGIYMNDSMNLEEPDPKERHKAGDRGSLTCEFCGTLFSKYWQLNKHLARVHHEVRRYVCTFCSKNFKQSNHLKEHITSHTGEKNYSCPICNKKFQRLSSQKRHVKSHEAPPGHKTKRTPFLCTICGKSFPFSNGVQRHMRIHLGIKKFECTMCHKKFTQSTHLQVHMRTHTGEKPYICDTCGEKFSLKACMLKHIHNRHFKAKSFAEDFPIFVA